MNRVILIGRFTRDPESRMGANNNEVLMSLLIVMVKEIPNLLIV